MEERPRLAIYLPLYLTISMTFVYRQLRGAQRAFDTSVLTTAVEHRDVFPCDDLDEVPPSAVDRLERRVRRALTGSTLHVGSRQRRRMAAALRGRGVDLVHAHFGPSGLDVEPVTTSLGIPLVVTFHGYDMSSYLRKPAYVKALPKLFEHAHCIAISDRMARQLRELGAPPNRVHTHYIGVPLDRFPFMERAPVAARIASGDQVRFLQVSNFVEKKGHRTTLDAFARYAKDVPRFRLTLAGDGPLRSEMIEHAAALGLAERVSFPGKVEQSQVVELMSDADVFVHHSVTASDGDQEGIPTVLMEAMARGLPVISTRHAGIAELIEDGREGFLVDERDVESYVAALKGLVHAPAEIARNARAKIERSFDMARQNEKLVEILRSTLWSHPVR